MFGMYHPFIWNESIKDIDTQTVYYMPQFDVILTGQFGTISLINADTGSSVTISRTDYVYTVKGLTVYSTRIKAALTNGVFYYLNIDNTYFSDIITRSTCVKEISTSNSCANQYHDWDTDPSSRRIPIFDPVQLVPTIETEKDTIITETGQQDIYKRVSKRYRLQFVAPSGMIQEYEALKLNDYVALEFVEIINIEIEAQEQEGGRYSLFTFSYQLKDELQDGNTCCDVIPLEDITSPGGGGSEDCGTFSVAIDYTSMELSVMLTDEPEGDVNYKWYKNGIYISAAESILNPEPGDYRVEVKIGGCTAKASYYINNPCAAFDIQLTKGLNTIAVAASNIPDGETVSYSVVLNGVEVATSMPYTALTTGTYFVYATAGECQKVRSIYVEIQDDDCDFTIDIIQDGSTLEADTDAASPVYSWEFENGSGRSVISSASEITAENKGIYFLTITNGACSKETYIYLEPTSNLGVFVIYRVTNNPVNVPGVDLKQIVVPQNELIVTLNGVVQMYTSGTPSGAQYTINGSGQLVFGVTPSNATVIIKTI